MIEGEHEPSDEALMRAYLGGDAKAFSLLFRRLAPRVHAYFVRVFRDSAVADDLLQTTFLKVHAGRANFRVDARVRPWVFGIATRVGYDRLRVHYRQAPTDGDGELGDLAASAPDPEAGIDLTREQDRVRAALDALPEGQRVVVYLHHFEGLSLTEVAQVLDLRDGTVRVRAFRAYAALREVLRSSDEREVQGA